jgi:hypothetical protein
MTWKETERRNRAGKQCGERGNGRFLWAFGAKWLFNADIETELSFKRNT